MFGANYYGSIYYGETYSVTYNVTFKTLTASVTTVAKLVKRVNLIRKPTVTTIATVLALYQKALSRLASAVTRALNFPRTTRALNFSRTTRRIL